MINMMITRIIHDLERLENNMNNIEAYIYTNLGMVDNHSLSNDELYEKAKYEIAMFNLRLSDLQSTLEEIKKVRY
jgi:hypothetical protein